MGRLDNKVAVITGAASGIGRATAIRFAAEGAAVVVADLNIDGGEATVRECREHAGRAVFQKTDVSGEADIKSMIARAVAEFGRLDITFNNAGFVGALGPLEEISAENWDRTHTVLLRGVFLGIKYSIPEMRNAGGGSIISTASIAGMRGGRGPTVYSAAKAGVINLTHCAAVELGKDRIRVNCICPGGIVTPITGDLAAEREPRAVPADSPRRPTGRYRRHGVVPGKRRVRMGDGGGDAGRRRVYGARAWVGQPLGRRFLGARLRWPVLPIASLIDEGMPPSA